MELEIMPSLGLSAGWVKGSFAEMGNVNCKTYHERQDKEHLRTALCGGKYECIPEFEARRRKMIQGPHYLSPESVRLLLKEGAKWW